MSNEIFSYTKLEEQNGRTIVEITANTLPVEIEAASRDAMEAIQNEILGAFPPHSVILVIDLSMFTIRSEHFNEAKSKDFTAELTQLSKEFYREIVHSGNGTVRLVVSFAKLMEPFLGIRVDQASDRNRALVRAREWANRKS